MKTSTQYKIMDKINENEIDINKKLCLKLGLFIVSLNPFRPNHKYDTSKDVISKFILECAKQNNPLLKAIFLGMACHYILDSFSYAHTIYNYDLKNFNFNTYNKHCEIEKSFDTYINKHINKKNETEIISVVENYFEPLSAELSIKKLHDIYLERCEVKYDEHARNLCDFSFSFNICKLLIKNYLI